MVARKCGTDIHSSQRMYVTDFGDFSSTTTMSLACVFDGNMLRNLVQIFMPPYGLITIIFRHPLIFNLAPPSDQNFKFVQYPNL